MGKLPANKIENTYNKTHRTNDTIICFAYENDLIQLYDFYCGRYRDITWEEFMNLGFNEFIRKLQSIPESEPLHNIIKSRTINIGKIKDKEEKKYWRELKEINRIPDIYIPNQELDKNLKVKLGGLKNGNKHSQVYGKNRNIK